MDGLTGLERDLLGYVAELTQACEQSVQALHDLEARSTDTIARQIAGLTACVTSLAVSQKACTEALTLWLSESATYTQVEKKLQLSRQALSALEAQLKSER